MTTPLTSWVETANTPDTNFPLENLPYGVFRTGKDAPSIGVAIGDSIFDLRAAVRAGLLDELNATLRQACVEPLLNRLMSLAPEAAATLRARLQHVLTAGSADQHTARSCLVPQSAATMLLPAHIGDYTDFYASIHHATNVGRLFRPDNPLLPNYKYVPIGYHGRSSSIAVSGHEVPRPRGQIKAPDADAPLFGPSRLLDYELELGCFIGQGNALGQPVALEESERHIFGLCLLNDWSARDIQSWEYQPLGPFLAKNFLTTISPWVVPLEALAPFRVPMPSRPSGDPAPLAYLRSAQDAQSGGFDIVLEVLLATAAMREGGHAPHRLSRSNARHLYWSLAQMLTHHTSNGCNLRPGDLLGTGTISGPNPDELGCLLEITRRGAEPVRLSTGEQRCFLADGDEVIFRAWCERPGVRRIGFGELKGTVVG